MAGSLASTIPGLVGRARFEVIPAKAIEEKVLEHVPRDRTITVTASPAKGLGSTISLAERLAGHGYRVVPHLSARLVVDGGHLRDLVDTLTAIGVDDVFVPAGDAASPAGRYEGSLSLLRDLDTLGRPFPNVGITGYPEHHPSIHDDVTVQAMWDKRQHATYIVSNLCFDPAAYRDWVLRVRARGVTLPILTGMAGPVDNTKLLSLAAKIGVGTSARMLSNHGGWFLRLAAPGGYRPDRLLGKLAPSLTSPDSRISGLHVFTFNQVAKAEAWRASVLARQTASAPARTATG